MDNFEDKKAVYYLESIARNLADLSSMADSGPSIPGEVLADNRDWLDCYITILRERANMPKA